MTKLDPVYVTYRLQKIKEMIANGESWEAIKARFNISRQRVYQLLQKEEGYTHSVRLASLPTMNQLYKFICDYKANHNGNSPSLAEARDAMCLGSMERVHYLLNRLVENHKVSIDGTRQSRNIEVVGSQWIPPASQ